MLVNQAFDVVSLTESQKLILKNRFTSLLEEYGHRSLRYSHSFHGLRVVITIGSLIVPAILSVQLTGYETDMAVYWVVWVLSLLVTISNALLTLLKIDKKYYMLNTVFHHILSEGWLYIELSGKYSGFKTPGEEPTHKNQFVYFCHTLEKIRMTQVEDEYFKLSEIKNNNSAYSTDHLIPPTPMKGLPFSISSDVNIKSHDLVNVPESKTTVLFGENSPKNTVVNIASSPNAGRASISIQQDE